MQATTKNICDQQLMQQICQGNEKALSQIIDRYNREISTLLHMHVKALPERQCEAITIVHFLECSNTEAASIMNISVNALESLLARGRRKLSSLCTGYYPILDFRISTKYNVNHQKSVFLMQIATMMVVFH